jgi:Ca2+-binding RTX toxin-like protein
MTDSLATIGNDNITQSPGTDTLTVTDSNQMQSGFDFFDGGLGLDTIVVGAVGAGTNILLALATDLTHGFHNYEAIKFQNTSGTSFAGFAELQFGTGLISTSLAVTGVNGSVQILAVGNATNFSAANWTFTNWENATDIVAIVGTVGADTLIGSIKSDGINGDAGADILTGGLGKDSLTGGLEADTFDFNRKTETVKGLNRDVIQDFSGFGLQGDLIDVHGIDANTTRGGNQNFKFIGAQKFHHRAGELQVKYDANTDIGIVAGDIDGNGKADFQIEVHSLNALVKADFIL